MESDNIETERSMLLTCMGLKQEEKVFVIYNPSRKSEAEPVMEATRALGCDVSWAAADEHISKDDKLPDAIEEGFGKADVVLLLVNNIQNQIFGHHPAKKQATIRGARIGFITTKVTGFSPDRIARIAHVSKALRDILYEADSAHLTSELGTDLKMDLTGREAIYFTNYLKNPGDWGAIPDYAEAAVSPVEGTTEGSLVVDGTIVGVGLLPNPTRFTISEGKITQFDDNREALAFKEILEKAEGDVYAIAELGLGTNEFASEFTGEFDDKKVLGGVHIGIGDNRTWHGSQVATVHIDLILKKVSLELDGKPLLENGRLVREI